MKCGCGFIERIRKTSERNARRVRGCACSGATSISTRRSSTMRRAARWRPPRRSMPKRRGDVKNGGNIAAAKAVGKMVAKRAIEKGVQAVLFDRGGYIYHGRVKALADAAREAGLKF